RGRPPIRSRADRRRPEQRDRRTARRGPREGGPRRQRAHGGGDRGRDGGASSPAVAREGAAARGAGGDRPPRPDAGEGQPLDLRRPPPAGAGEAALAKRVSRPDAAAVAATKSNRAERTGAERGWRRGGCVA